MALVLFLRGINVGGHRTFRPTSLAGKLKQFDAVNIGAAGTFVIRKPVTRTRLRAEVRRILPFEADMVICRGREIDRLVSRDPFAGRPVRAGIVPFVGILSRRTRAMPSMPVRVPSGHTWLLTVLGKKEQFVFGLYRRNMKVIGCFGLLDRLFGAPITIRSWSTITSIARILHAENRIR